MKANIIIGVMSINPSMAELIIKRRASSLEKQLTREAKLAVSKLDAIELKNIKTK